MEHIPPPPDRPPHTPSQASRSKNKAFVFSSFLRATRTIATRVFKRAANEEAACELLYLRHFRPHTAEYVEAYEGPAKGAGGGGGDLVSWDSSETKSAVA